MVKFWDTEIGRWASGDDRLHPDLERWRAAYNGRGQGAIDLSVLPEPHIGPLAAGRTPALVMLGLNPGAAALHLQSIDGLYTQRIRQTSYAEWAASGPYSDNPWESVNGRNRYQQNRVAFARRLHQNPAIRARDLLYMELYPFHSKRVTGPIAPPPDLLTRFVLDPIAELDTPFVFAFGKPWLTVALILGLGGGLRSGKVAHKPASSAWREGYPASLGSIHSTAWTHHSRTTSGRCAFSMRGNATVISNEQIAHDLAIVYLVNRYGAEVVGDFSVETSYGDDNDVTGSGSVETRRLSDVDRTRTVRRGTGERHFLGLLEKKEWVSTGEYCVDPVFRHMISDYHSAYVRFLELLTAR